jgi:hypothetical protein
MQHSFEGSNTVNPHLQSGQGFYNQNVPQHIAAYWAGYYHGVLERQNGTEQDPSVVASNIGLSGSDVIYFSYGHSHGWLGIPPACITLKTPNGN